MPKLIKLPDGSTGKFPDEMPDEEIASILLKEFPPETKHSAKDYAAAATTGATSGVLTGLGGLPVNTIANVLDLGKAGAGYLASKLSKDGQVPEWTEPMKRDEVPGTSEWIADKIRKYGAGAMITNPASDTEGGRMLHDVGSFAGQAAVFPAASAKNMLGNVARAVPAGVAASAVGQTTDDPALAALAALTVGAAPAGIANTTRYALRGGDANRGRVNQTIQDFKQVGLNPSLGEALQGTPHAAAVQGVENLVSGLPGGLDRMRNFKQAHHDQLQKLAENAGGVGANPDIVGRNIQQGLANKIAGVRQVSRDINDNLALRGGPDTRVEVPATKAMLQRMTEQAPSDPDINALLQIPHTQQLQRAIDTTTAPVLPRQVPHPSGLLDPTGNPYTITIPGRPGQGVAMSSLRPLQQQLGEDAFANFTVTPPSNIRQQRQLYGAIGDDMAQGLQAADPIAAQQLRRSKALNTSLLGSNSATSPVRGRLETIEPLLATNMVPERAFASMESRITGQNPNLTEFNAIKKSLPPGVRKQFASSLVNRMGRASNSRQDETGGEFSQETFLTNYSKLTPEARKAVFSGFSGATELRQQTDALARVIANKRAGAQIYGNPSGTANRGGAMGIYGGVLGGMGASMATLNPLPVMAGLAVPLNINLAARALTNPKITKFTGSADSPLNSMNSLMRVATTANRRD